jgi:hypothetical protein
MNTCTLLITYTECLTVLLKDGLGGRRQARLPLPLADLGSLIQSVREAFQPELDAQVRERYTYCGFLGSGRGYWRAGARCGTVWGPPCA